MLPCTDEFLRWANLNVDQQIKDTPKNLILPHPRLHNRAFVLLLLKEIDKAWIHPVFKKSVNQLIKEIEPDEYKNIKLL